MSKKLCDWCGEAATVETSIPDHGEPRMFYACSAHEEYLGLVGEMVSAITPSADRPKRTPKARTVQPDTKEWEVRSALYGAMNTRNSAILNAERLAPIVLAGLRIAHREGVEKAIDSLKRKPE